MKATPTTSFSVFITLERGEKFDYSEEHGHRPRTVEVDRVLAQFNSRGYASVEGKGRVYRKDGTLGHAQASVRMSGDDLPQQLRDWILDTRAAAVAEYASAVSSKEW